MHFEGEVHAEWLRHAGDDRRMRLLRPFVFVDDDGTRWIAEAGDQIDGASIPEFLWTVAGSPFIGDYRRATVIHDVACQKRLRPSKEVHRMFYFAMRCDSVPEDVAIKFYTAVRLFGPRWEIGPLGEARVSASAAGVPPGLDFDRVSSALDVILDD
jgi:hypothetical protein